MTPKVRGADPTDSDRYRLKWMTPDGRIVWFDADARTGRVLGPDFAGARRHARPSGISRRRSRGSFPTTIAAGIAADAGRAKIVRAWVGVARRGR